MFPVGGMEANFTSVDVSALLRIPKLLVRGITLCSEIQESVLSSGLQFY